MEIKIVSHLSCDGYYLDGKFYYCSERNKIAKHFTLEDIENIVWVRGDNAFTGKLVDSQYFHTMKKKLLEEIFKVALAPVLK